METNKNNKIAIILLGAGSSSRLGKPKQLLDIKGKYLLQQSIDVSKHSGTNQIILVLGAYGSEIEKLLDLNGIKTVHNPVWEKGLTSSIKIGLEAAMMAYPKMEVVLLMMCDQPLLSATVLNQIISLHFDTGKPIINCNYGIGFGPPTLFHKSLFSHLLNLTSTDGAKNVIKRFPESVVSIDFPNGDIDIDTAQDYENFLNR